MSIMNAKYAGIFCFLIFFGGLGQHAKTQTSHLDSLRSALHLAIHDTSKLVILEQLALGLLREDIDQAETFTIQLIDFAESLLDSNQYATGSHYLGLIHRFRTNYLAAIQASTKALMLWQKIDTDPLKQTGPLRNLAHVYRKLGDLETATKYLHEVLDLYKEAGQRSGIANALNSLGSVQNDLKNYEVARGYFQRALQLSEQVADTVTQTIALHNLAATYLPQSTYDSAQIMLTKSLALNQTIQDHHGLAFDYSTQADLYRRLGQLNKARDAAEQALLFAKRIGNHGIEVSTMEILSEIELAAGNYHRALKYTDSVLQMESYQPSLLIAMEIFKNRSAIFRKQKLLEDALEMTERQMELADSAFNREKEQVVRALEVKYQVKEQENEIKQLEETNQLKNEALLKSEKNTRLLLIGLALAMFSLVLAIRFYQLRLKARALTSEAERQRIIQLEHERDINNLNSMLKGQEQERARIAQDLHDGLGALLATIRSHFNKIHEELADLDNLNLYGRTKSLINEASEEVRRISHNMMPASLKLLGLTAAVRDLVDHLCDVHLEVTVETFGEETELPEATTIMSYRIIQELAHNVVRHARAHHMLLQILFSDKTLSITVEDDGIGFANTPTLDGLGLRSVKSRVSYLEGSINIISQPQQGTSIQIEIPYPSTNPV